MSYALVAQRLEQRTHNPLVVGSNPTEGTISNQSADTYSMRSFSTPNSLFTKLFALSYLLSVCFSSVPAASIGIDRTGLVYCPLQKKWVPPAFAEARTQLDLSEFCVRRELREKFTVLPRLSTADEAALFDFLGSSGLPRQNEREMPGPTSNFLSASIGSHTANYQYQAIRASIDAGSGVVADSVEPRGQTFADFQPEYFTSAHLQCVALRGPPLS